MMELEFTKHTGFLHYFNNYQPRYQKMGECVLHTSPALIFTTVDKTVLLQY
jgi:hypothetical protein